MRKIFLSIILLIFTALLMNLFLAGCQTGNPLQDFKRIRLGMEKADVVEIMGTVQRQERKSGREWWYYNLYSHGAKYERMVVFENGKVIYSGRVTTPAYVKDADKIDQQNDAINKTVESQNERDRVNFLPTQNVPPVPAESQPLIPEPTQQP